MATEVLTLRVPDVLLQRLDRVLESKPPPEDRTSWTRSDLARVALTKGLDALEAESDG